MRWPPSKDPGDYQHPTRPPPRWLAWLLSDSGVPYRTHLLAGAGGVFAALAITGDLLAGLGGGLMAQAILELAGRRPES
jgi:hypothetical protein